MKARIFRLLPLLLVLITACTSRTPVALQLVESEMKRNPQSWQLDFQQAPQWGYAAGVELLGLYDACDYYGAPEGFEAWADTWCDTLVNADGTIATCRAADANLDNLCSARLLFRALDTTGDAKYRAALDSLFLQLVRQPRNAEGGFWHKGCYPDQMWLDGLYMAEPFYARYLATFPDAVPSQGDTPFPMGWDDIALQFRLAAQHTFDPSLCVYRHAWDASGEQAWAEPGTGKSPHAWGRALGWYGMALVDVLDWMPADQTQARTILTGILNIVATGIKQSQDAESGLWYQLLDAPEAEGNYLESSCSAMFVYTLAKAVRLGWIDPRYITVAQRGWEALQSRFVTTDPSTGLVTLEGTCAVAGLGGTPYRDGSVQYYLSEPVRANDPKGIGPFLMASVQMDRYAAEQSKKR